jgi:Protein of unknown function (DUF1059)
MQLVGEQLSASFVGAERLRAVAAAGVRLHQRLPARLAKRLELDDLPRELHREGMLAAEHAKRDHGVSQIDAATLAKVKAAIRSS